MNPPKHILPLIVISQFFCTSLWFAGNGVLDDLILNFNLNENALGYLTSSVQFGFIIGTFIFALLSIADRFSPSKVFFVCALLGSGFNLLIIGNFNSYESLLLWRFLTGFFLAGIYPVGMKIAADYYEKGLGKSLGFLVGALVLGTAFPHLLKDVKGNYPWEFVLITTSSLAVLGGLLMLLFIPDGPFRKASIKMSLGAIPKIFSEQKFRMAAFGYFGHMWELYAFWAFVPFILQLYLQFHPGTNFNVPLLSFLIIGIGSVGCIISGLLAQKLGLKKVAFIALLSSCLCCLFAPLLFYLDSPILFTAFLLFWGLVVIADSPLFSTLVAQNAPLKLKGTALTIVNSIGFFLSILSIQILNELSNQVDSPSILLVLAMGPILALIGLLKKKKKVPNPLVKEQ